jgi:hypothetical protein
LIDVTVKERIAGYKQQAKLIQQLVDKLKEHELRQTRHKVNELR